MPTESLFAQSHILSPGQMSTANIHSTENLLAGADSFVIGQSLMNRPNNTRIQLPEAKPRPIGWGGGRTKIRVGAGVDASFPVYSPNKQKSDNEPDKPMYLDEEDVEPRNEGSMGWNGENDEDEEQAITRERLKQRSTQVVQKVVHRKQKKPSKSTKRKSRKYQANALSEDIDAFDEESDDDLSARGLNTTTNDLDVFTDLSFEDNGFAEDIGHRDSRGLSPLSQTGEHAGMGEKKTSLYQMRRVIKNQSSASLASTSSFRSTGVTPSRRSSTNRSTPKAGQKGKWDPAVTVGDLGSILEGVTDIQSVDSIDSGMTGQ